MIVNVNDYDYKQIWLARKLPKPRGNQHGQKAVYKNLVCAFDIETTRLSDIEQAFMYIWQFQIEDVTIIGRTWPQFLNFLKEIKRRLRGQWLCCYIHNASYEFQFLKGIYDFEPDEVFATESRKILKFTMFDAIEFRCSYLHSNMSLAEFLRKMGVKDQKQSGFDYNKIRYPWTPLTDSELLYCINDVRGLVEALKIEMAHDGDNLYTIPLTSTGYVRRDCKKAMKKYNYRQLKAMLPTPDIYRLLREAFRGGNTHASRWYAKEILSNVYSCDRSSSYPDVMINQKFPMTPFHLEGYADAARMYDLIFKKHKAVIMRVKFENIKERDIYIGCPYLSKDKCRNIYKGVFDNGRVLEAEYLETTLTDVDFKMVRDLYTWTACEAETLAYARYGELPQPLKDVIIDYYKKKTELKGVSGQELYYLKSKNKLNSCYGMCAQDPVKDSIDFIHGEYVQRDDDLEYLLAKSNKKAFLCYQWGVWVTAWARYMLHLAIMETAKDSNGHNFVYADTDSIKTIGRLDLTKYNEQRKAASIKNGAFATDPAGVVHYMGVFEDETPEPYKAFSTMGAKKYVYEDAKGLHITIAGVNKSKGAAELGNIENFKEGFIFKLAGGTESIYNDNVYMEIERDGHKLVITDNVVIRDSTYTLGLSGDYERLLNRVFEIKYSEFDIPGFYKYKR